MQYHQPRDGKLMSKCRTLRKQKYLIPVNLLPPAAPLAIKNSEIVSTAGKLLPNAEALAKENSENDSSSTLKAAFNANSLPAKNSELSFMIR